MLRVLFLTHRLPYAPNRGDRIRAYHILRALRRHASVDVVSLAHDADEANHAGEMGELAASVHLAHVNRFRNWMAAGCRLPTTTPVTHSLLDSSTIRQVLSRVVAEQRPDVVLAYCSGMARFALEPPLAGLPLVIELVDVDSLKWKTLAETAHGPLRWIYRREAKWLSRFEARAARAAYATTVVNERERDAMAALAPDARVAVVPSGVDADYWRPHTPPARSHDVVFCGVMNYAPNEEGALWLAREVWPLVRNRCSDARLRLVGSNPTTAVRALSESDASIEVTGGVPDVRPFLWEAAVAAAPLAQARGIQNKVLEAVAAGLPTVVTPVVAEGLPEQVLPACQTASGAGEFADAIVGHLMLDPADRRKLASCADLTALTWEGRLSPLIDLLQAASNGSASKDRKI